MRRVRIGGGRHQHQFGAQRAQRVLFLAALGFGHDDDGLVAARRTDDGQGWYEAEADGRWSGPSTESSIELPPLAAGTYLVELHIADAMSPELVAGTQLQAQLSDGQTLPVELVHEFGAATGLYPMVSAGVLQLPEGVQGSWQLKLVLPEVISPANQGGDDTRQLGLRLQGLRLSQQPADTPEAAT
jgi:hypothetical protein